MSDKPLEIKFEEGCFDQFDGTQEELDELIANIKEMFANMTPEELEAQSRPVDIDAMIKAGEVEEAEFLMSALNRANNPRTLQ